MRRATARVLRMIARRLDPPTPARPVQTISITLPDALQRGDENMRALMRALRTRP